MLYKITCQINCGEWAIFEKGSEFFVSSEKINENTSNE